MKSKILKRVKLRTLIILARKYLAQMICTNDYVVASGMNYIEDECKPKCSHRRCDYVRVASLELIAQEIKEKNLQGAVAELGVFRGSFAKEINALFPDRELFLFDTFEGFDKRDVETEVQKKFSIGDQNFSDTSVEFVLSRMPYREKCIIKKGWFPETTKGLEKQEFSFVSIDADLFEPIYEGLRFFYPRLLRGGAIFIHDYNNREYKGSKAAVRKFCEHSGERVTYFPLCDECGTAVIVK